MLENWHIDVLSIIEEHHSSNFPEMSIRYYWKLVHLLWLQEDDDLELLRLRYLHHKSVLKFLFMINNGLDFTTTLIQILTVIILVFIIYNHWWCGKSNPFISKYINMILKSPYMIKKV